MRVAIAGSRRLPAGQAPRLLIRFLAALPADARILLRKGRFIDPNRFEQDVANLCAILHLEWDWFVPEITEESFGRAAVYHRDMNMVEAADLVLLFFSPEEAVSGYSGTAHLMDKSLDADRPVYAYTVADDGKVARIGEYDPEHLYADLAPFA